MCAAISHAQAPAAAAAWKNDGFEFLGFAAKTVGCCEMVKFAQSITVGNQ
jgi:hypothetical protein